MKATERRRIKRRLRFDSSVCVGCKQKTSKRLVKDSIMCDYCGHVVAAEAAPAR